MRKTELNKMNGGGYTSKKRKIGIIILSLLMAVGLSLGVVFGVQDLSRAGDSIIWGNHNNGSSGANLGDLANGDVETYDEKYILKDGEYSDAPTKKDVWNTKVLATANNGKKVLVTMGENWVAAGGATGYLGTGASGVLTIPNGFDITFDLAGHTLDRNTGSSYVDGARHFAVQAGGALTINDTVGTGVVKGARASSGTAGIDLSSTASATAKLTINGGTFTQNYAGDGFGTLINARGIFVMNGGIITQNGETNSGSASGVIGVGGSNPSIVGKFTMNGGEISDNVHIGGAVTVGSVWRSGSTVTEQEVGEFIMNGGTIKNNKTRDSSLINESTIISRNYGRGGGVNVATSKSKFTMNGGTIEGNSVPLCAGGVSNVGTFTMNGGTITGNKAGYYPDGSTSTYSSYAGGISTLGTFVMNGGSVSNNTSRVYCGGIYCSGVGAGLAAKVAFNAGNISGNKALGSGSSGGGIFLDANNDVTIKNIVVTGNSLPNSMSAGGGVLHTPNTVVKWEGAFICRDNKNQNGESNYGLHDLTSWNKDLLQLNGPLVSNGQIMDVGIHVVKAMSDTEQRAIMKNGVGSIGWTGSYLNPDAGVNYTISGDKTTLKLWYRKTQDFIPGDVAWRYLEEVNGVATWKDPGTETVGSYTITKNTLTLPYNPNRKITGIWAKYLPNGNTSGQVWNYAEGDGVVATPPADSSYTSGAHFINYTDTHGGTGVTTIKEPGAYAVSFDHYCNQFSQSSNYLRNSTFHIEILPVDVTVTMNDISGIYGDKLELGSAKTNSQPAVAANADLSRKLATADNGMDVADLGIYYIKSYGTDAGDKTVVLPLGWTNKKYNVTFVGSGSYTIGKRPVTVVLNDDYITYGDKTAIEGNVQKTALNGSNSILTKGVNSTTKYQDADGKDFTISSPVTGVSGTAYKGGWYYSTDVGGGKASAQFIASDTPSNTFPFEYEITNYTASTDKIAGDTGNFINVKKYTVTVKNTNSNYNVTFVNAQTGTSGSTGSFIYEVRKAELSVDTTLPSLDNDDVPGADFLTSTYNADNQNIELPAAAVVKKGAQSATTASDITPEMRYWSKQYTEEEYTDASHTAPEATRTEAGLRLEANRRSRMRASTKFTLKFR